ncbi:11S globulin subunit beta [Artemisia annua]|uniref:11S globulin subunit beta n=1 Tax=Artemisia annua TaxID=35608 RepID=A0A2U1QKW4_ARTAN|nr:11S globulin subunit beta [Artemisia annua]
MRIKMMIPQNYAVINRAGQQGCRWVAFKSNENAMISNLAGRVPLSEACIVSVGCLVMCEDGLKETSSKLPVFACSSYRPQTHSRALSQVAIDHDEVQWVGQLESEGTK